MSQGTLTLREHPARATLPDGQLLIDPKTKKTVPLITDQQLIMLDGIHVGFCGDKPGMPVCLIVDLPGQVKESIREFVAEQVGAVSRLNSVGPLVADEDEEDDE